MRRRLPLLALVCCLDAASSQGRVPGPEIVTSDVDRFYRLYDAAGGLPAAEALQRDYIDAGTAAVREFVPYRILSGEKLAAMIRTKPEVYKKARECLSVLPEVRRRLRRAFARLVRLYPEARLPPVTILVGRNNTGGTSGPSGVIIGLEAICSTARAGETVADRFVYVIAHEYGHVEQTEKERSTLLEQSLVEGVPELVAELTTGHVSNSQLLTWTKGREVGIGQRFLRDADGTDTHEWLYNGEGSSEKPGDLGYWVGYRIARLYFLRATDKRAALRELLELKDARSILAESGWKPGL